MWARVHLVLVLVVFLIDYLQRIKSESTTIDTGEAGGGGGGGGESSADFFGDILRKLWLHKRMFLEGYHNGTAAMERNYNFLKQQTAPDTGRNGVSRGRRKNKQVQRALVAIIVAYTLKFMFLVPSFIGTLILLKFTAGLAGFFYALFATVIGLDHPIT
ncbi:hypothetical protein TKK_0010750 [Trichogramma kaykai]